MAFLSSSSIFAMSARLLIRRRSISHTRKNRRRHTHKSWESMVQWLKSPLFTFPFSSQYGLSHGSSTGRGRTSSQTKSTAAYLDGYLRSEEHTSELQSHYHIVCRLLL